MDLCLLIFDPFGKHLYYIAVKYEDGERGLLPAGTDTTIAVYNITGIVDFVKENAHRNLGDPKVEMTLLILLFSVYILLHLHDRCRAGASELYAGCGWNGKSSQGRGDLRAACTAC